MTAKTFRACVLLIAPDVPEEDVGERPITVVNIVEAGRRVGLHATFDHRGRSVSGSVAKISPSDWEQAGVIPIVQVNRSFP